MPKATDEQITQSSRIIEVSGEEFEVFPLSDRDLTSITNWIRFKIQKDARAQAEFAESRQEAEQLKADAFTHSLSAEWWNSLGINILLNSTDGIVELVYRMIRKKFKKEWFKNKFGEPSKFTDEQLENRSIVQNTFIEQNAIKEDEAVTPEADSKSQKKESSKPKKTSIEK